MSERSAGQGGVRGTSYIPVSTSSNLTCGKTPPVTACAVPAACGRPGRGSASPPGCHSLPRLRFAYPQNEGAKSRFQLMLSKTDKHFLIVRNRFFMPPKKQQPCSEEQGCVACRKRPLPLPMGEVAERSEVGEGAGFS